MAAVIQVAYDKSFRSGRAAAPTLAYLSDLKTAIPTHFQGLQSFLETGPDQYEWIFPPVGHSGYTLQIKLATRKRPIQHHTLELEPIPKAGYSPIHASWTITPEGDHSTVRFRATLETELPIPSLLKSMAAPIAQRELSKFFDRYIQNVSKTLAA